MRLYPPKEDVIFQKPCEYNHISNLVLAQHDHYDGFSYSYRIKIENISLMAKIIAVEATGDKIINEDLYKSCG